MLLQIAIDMIKTKGRHFYNAAKAKIIYNTALKEKCNVK